MVIIKVVVIVIMVMVMVIMIMIMVVVIVVMVMVIVVMASIDTSLDRFLHNGLEEILSIIQLFCVPIRCPVIFLFLGPSYRCLLQTSFVNFFDVLKEGFDGGSFDESNFCCCSVSRSVSDHCLGVLEIRRKERKIM